MMVSVIEYDANRELCDSGPRFNATTIASHCTTVAAADAAADDLSVSTTDCIVDNDAALAKRAMKLELSDQRQEKGSLDNEDDEKTAPELLSPMSNSSKSGCKSSGGASMPNTKAIVHTEVIDDRKALRDALYQGIFHRHRRTIFAMGSFIRMLKSRNSQYNTIRSASDGEEEPR